MSAHRPTLGHSVPYGAPCAGPLLYSGSYIALHIVASSRPTVGFKVCAYRYVTMQEDVHTYLRNTLSVCFFESRGAGVFGVMLLSRLRMPTPCYDAYAQILSLVGLGCCKRRFE